MKVFVFVRGVDTPFKRSVVQRLMDGLNPDINSVSALCVSLTMKLPHYFHVPTKKQVKEDMRAADKDCKNLVRKLLAGSHEEQFIVVDNESIQPVHWQSYYNLTDKVCVEAIAVGLDVYSSEKFFDEDEKRKNNEQSAKKDMFIASMAKYLRIEKDEDVLEALKQLDKLRKE